MDHIYLVPGFFGFANLGDMRYFGHVKSLLERLATRPVAIHVVATRPTASLPVRAAALHATIAATALPGEPLTLVGHSSGGLDARLWATPGVVLPEGADPTPWLGGLRAVVTVSTPHHGTPSAEVFTTAAGKSLLRLLSLMTIVVLRRGGSPLRAMLRIGDRMLSVERLLGASPDILDEVFQGLLSELSPERRSSVEAFFTEISVDQGLLSQLMPDAMDLFDAATADRPGVRYGCVVGRAQPPGVRGVLASGPSPVAQATFATYAMCWHMASKLTRRPPIPDELQAALTARWPGLDLGDNDGMVPTLSQPHGTLIRAVDADHLDVLGHFGDEGTDPPSFDWFNTGTGFTREHFEALWTDVTRFMEEGVP